MTQRSDSRGAPGHRGFPEPCPTSGSPAAPYAGSVYNRCSLAASRGHKMPERPSHSLWGARGETKAAGAGLPPWSSRGEIAAGRRRTPSGHMCHPAPRVWGAPHAPAQPHPAPSPDSRAKPSGPRAMVADQYTHVAPAWAAGPLGPARPQASSLAGRQAGRRLRKPAARGLRKGLHQPPTLPASGRAEAGWPRPAPAQACETRPAAPKAWWGVGARMPPTAPARHRGSTVPQLPSLGPARMLVPRKKHGPVHTPPRPQDHNHVQWTRQPHVKPAPGSP